MQQGLLRAIPLCGVLLTCAPHLPTPTANAPVAEHDPVLARAFKKLHVQRARALRPFYDHLALLHIAGDAASFQIASLLTSIAVEHEARRRLCGSARGPMIVAITGQGTALTRSFAAALEVGLSKHPDFTIAERRDATLETEIEQQHQRDALDSAALATPGKFAPIRVVGFVETDIFTDDAYVRAKLVCVETRVSIANAATLLTATQRAAEATERERTGRMSARQRMERERAERTHAREISDLYRSMLPAIEESERTP